jgi:hypothetical protein
VDAFAAAHGIATVAGDCTFAAAAVHVAAVEIVFLLLTAQTGHVRSVATPVRMGWSAVRIQPRDIDPFSETTLATIACV